MPESAPAAVVELAMRLPAADLTRLAEAATAGRLAALRSRATSPVLREACGRLIAIPGISGDYLAGLLIGASAAVERVGADQQVDIVWTGPDSGIQTSRLTAPTMTNLIDSAAAELILVTFASRDEPRLVEAVTAAVGRGVDVTVLFERNEDNPSYTRRQDVFGDLPVRRWVWPKAGRPLGATLHAKIVVVDRRTALLGSANLTGRAFGANLECGVLLRGGPHPAAVHDHLWSLRYRRVLSDA